MSKFTMLLFTTTLSLLSLLSAPAAHAVDGENPPVVSPQPDVPPPAPEEKICRNAVIIICLDVD